MFKNFIGMFVFYYENEKMKGTYDCVTKIMQRPTIKIFDDFC